MKKISQHLKNLGMGSLLVASVSLFPVAAHADRLAEIQARGSLICATLANNEPLGFPDPQTSQIVGFDVDMCSAVARKLGVRMQHKSVTVEARLPTLMQGQADLLSAALGYTRQRAHQIDFTAAHYQNPIKLIVHSDSGLNLVSDLADKRISANRNSTPEQAAHRVLPKATLVTFPDTPQAFLALAQGKVDALAISMPSGIRFVNESGGRFRFVEGALAWEPTALGVKKGEHKLLDAVNQALAALEKEGEIDALWSKWFGPKTKFNIARDKKLTPIASLR
ncbi:amino acid ABC transporter substrate-binding protein [Herbaspirillum rubrisubalbicans]|uniref:Amino acid ABC transporter substrate-binding protein n=1 Tax=Herbaspirillum rubrisubalbicans TaxID=80842 RepID=A0ABX9BVW8_9BURK|nr:ABC transporter substrate-binding protein [Herbaspirillum rubrisubalbicans]MCP1571658.1 polar amino acid transport system substrate-binding protein [Herbaspirillum rubrisubalbicans]NQE51346.1 amino acid ABC transporter substrate-binding protein [Herbaspirillum rubrisubalbicans]RAM61785.1 amino acid ABC transporter substrate-binding protein [Herbaspirillum rubrisubalbicans]RAN43985.1 amino acid ABC transporter substrate-binding protein [Herbaspirillum rubrisubalbicans]